MSEFKVGEHTYRTRQLDGRRQFHIARRLLPVVMSGGGSEDGAQAFNMMAALSAMPDADADFVINSCLAVVDRQDAGSQNWFPILTPEGVFKFADIQYSMAAIIQLIIPVFQENAQGFLSSLPPGSIGEIQAKMTAAVSKLSS